MTVCSTDLDPVGLRISKFDGTLTFGLQARVPLTHVANPPKPDWEPFGAYAVSNHGRAWGVCLEFSHEGLRLVPDSPTGAYTVGE